MKYMMNQGSPPSFYCSAFFVYEILVGTAFWHFSAEGSIDE